MTSMRNFMKVAEAYSSNNSYFLHYMKDGDFDPYALWYYICEWIEENGYLDAMSEAAGIEINSAHELNEQEPDLFYKLPESVQKQCAKEVVDHVMSVDPAEAPSSAHMDLQNNRMIPRSSWLVHFTNAPYEIAQSGFTLGTDQMDRLGLTSWFKNEAKTYGGYNFAFIANSRDARKAEREGKYGKSAVLFQNSGVHVYHHGDDENQIVFWGADVNPREIVVLIGDYGEWKVMTRRPMKNGNDVAFQGDFTQCVQWVEANYQQYRKWL